MATQAKMPFSCNVVGNIARKHFHEHFATRIYWTVFGIDIVSIGFNLLCFIILSMKAINHPYCCGKCCNSCINNVIHFKIRVSALFLDDIDACTFGFLVGKERITKGSCVILTHLRSIKCNLSR